MPFEITNFSRNFVANEPVVTAVDASWFSSVATYYGVPLLERWKMIWGTVGKIQQCWAIWGQPQILKLLYCFHDSDSNLDNKDLGLHNEDSDLDKWDSALDV